MEVNISTYIAQIESASRGEEVRDSIINALNAIVNAVNSNISGGGTGEGTGGTGGGTSDTSSLLEVFNSGMIGDTEIYDATPIINSKRAVQSGGLFILLGDIEAILDRINGEVK